MPALNCLAVIGVAILALPASGQVSPPQNPSAQAAPHYDPNEIVCEKQEVIGSRLATKRVCKTRSQWATERLQNRQEIDRIQIQRGNSGNE